MLKTLTEITALSEGELLQLIEERPEPVLITCDGEPRFVAQSLEAYEAIVRRIRALEAEAARKPSNLIPFRRK